MLDEQVSLAAKQRYRHEADLKQVAACAWTNKAGGKLLKNWCAASLAYDVGAEIAAIDVLLRVSAVASGKDIDYGLVWVPTVSQSYDYQRKFADDIPCDRTCAAMKPCTRQ